MLAMLYFVIYDMEHILLFVEIYSLYLLHGKCDEYDGLDTYGCILSKPHHVLLVVK